MGRKVQPRCLIQEMIDKPAERTGPGLVLVPPVIQAPAAQGSGWIDLSDGARSGPVYRVGCPELCEQYRATESDVSDPVSRDAERCQLALLMDEEVGPAHR